MTRIDVRAQLLAAALACCAALATLAISTPAWSEPGDTLYSQKSGVNVRSEPSASSSVRLRLGIGHELVEFSRQGEWVNVGIARAGGKDGWIHASLVGPVSPGGGSLAPVDARFDAFVRDVEARNAKLKGEAGLVLFSNVENLGDGIVQVTAGPNWGATAVAVREANVTALLDLWAARETSGLPIAVYVINAHGEVLMQKAGR